MNNSLLHKELKVKEIIYNSNGINCIYEDEINNNIPKIIINNNKINIKNNETTDFNIKEIIERLHR